MNDGNTVRFGSPTWATDRESLPRDMVLLAEDRGAANFFRIMDAANHPFMVEYQPQYGLRIVDAALLAMANFFGLGSPSDLRLIGVIYPDRSTMAAGDMDAMVRQMSPVQRAELAVQIAVMKLPQAIGQQLLSMVNPYTLGLIIAGVLAAFIVPFLGQTAALIFGGAALAMFFIAFGRNAIEIFRGIYNASVAGNYNEIVVAADQIAAGTGAVVIDVAAIVVMSGAMAAGRRILALRATGAGEELAEAAARVRRVAAELDAEAAALRRTASSTEIQALRQQLGRATTQFRRLAAEEALETGVINRTSRARAGVLTENELNPRHHLFPEEHSSWFTERGIDVNQYTVRIPRVHHEALHSGGGPGRGGGWYSEEVMNILRARERVLGRQLTPWEIEEQGIQFMERFGFGDGWVLPFGD